MGLTQLPRRTRPRVITGTTTLPASYATGGYTLDLSTRLASLNVIAFQWQAMTIGLPIDMVAAINSPSAGKAQIKVSEYRYKKLTAMGAVTNLPSGVSLATVSGQTVNSESSHVHPQNHNHLVTTSSTPGTAGVGVLTLAAAANMSTHTHSEDPPNLNVNTGAGTAHNHVFNVLYSHKHTITNTGTVAIRQEVVAGTDLSGVIATFVAVGV